MNGGFGYCSDVYQMIGEIPGLLMRELLAESNDCLQHERGLAHAQELVQLAILAP